LLKKEPNDQYKSLVDGPLPKRMKIDSKIELKEESEEQSIER
jgi:hypothetical protein